MRRTVELQAPALGGCFLREAKYGIRRAERCAVEGTGLPARALRGQSLPRRTQGEEAWRRAHPRAALCRQGVEIGGQHRASTERQVRGLCRRCPSRLTDRRSVAANLEDVDRDASVQRL